MLAGEWIHGHKPRQPWVILSMLVCLSCSRFLFLFPLSFPFVNAFPSLAVTTVLNGSLLTCFSCPCVSWWNIYYILTWLVSFLLLFTNVEINCWYLLSGSICLHKRYDEVEHFKQISPWNIKANCFLFNFHGLSYLDPNRPVVLRVSDVFCSWFCMTGGFAVPFGTQSLGWMHPEAFCLKCCR